MFCQHLDVFAHFFNNQFNHEKSTKIKVILKKCVVTSKNSTNNPEGNPFSEHHGLRGQMPKKSKIYVFPNSAIYIPNSEMPIKTIQNIHNDKMHSSNPFPRVSRSPSLTQNILFCEQFLIFYHRMMLRSNIIKPTTKHDTISSKLIPKHRKYLYIWSTQGVKHPYFDRKD